MKTVLVLMFTSLILVSGCVQENKTDAEALCIQLCQEEKSKGTDLSDGPCLSNNIAPDWVCDVAHSPRIDVDNQPENQCSAFGETAQHFIEVDTDCNFIKRH